MPDVVRCSSRTKYYGGSKIDLTSGSPPRSSPESTAYTVFNGKLNLQNDEYNGTNISNLVKDIFGEDLNKSSIEASVLQTIKDYKKGK